MKFISRRNFLRETPLNAHKRMSMKTSSETVFALRSLPAPQGPVEIPRRFSSSSLPPSFVSGRFAGFSYSAHRASGV
jgi:hypothetical protein